MRRKPATIRSIVVAAAALLSACGLAAPAEAQLITSNPRVNNGQLMIDPLLCQTDYQVRQAIAAAGFTHIFLNAPIQNQIRARASRGNAVYLIDYDRCLDPRIIGIQRLRSSK